MASNGSISKSALFGNVTLSWSTISQDVYTKKSTISYKLTIYRTSNITSNITKDYWIKFNGVTVSSGVDNIGGSGTKTLASGTLTLTHDSDGECAFTLAFSQEINITWSGKSIGILSASGSGALNKISTPTIPMLSASTVAIGSNLTITLNRDKPTYLHKLTYTWGSQLVNVEIASGVDTSYTWTVPNDFMNYIPNGTSGTCYLTVTTYDSGGTIGTNTVSFTGTVPESILPKINSVTLSDTGPSSNLGWGVWVQGKSRLNVAVNASGIYGSRITVCNISGLGNTINSTNGELGVLAASGSVTINITVTDSRGRTVTTDRTISVEAYSEPVIEIATIERANNAGTPIDNGTYAKIILKASGSSVAANNTVEAKIYHMRSDLTAWTLARTIPITYSIDQTVMIADMIASRSYAYKIELSDAFGVATAEMTLRAEGAVIGWLAGGLGVSFGKAAEEPYTADFDWKIHGRKGAQFDSDVTVSGELVAGDLSVSGNLSGDGAGITRNGLPTLHCVDIASLSLGGTNFQLGTTNVYTKIPFSKYAYNITNVLTISENGILIPAGVRAVKISAQICLGAATAGVRYAQISKNSWADTVARSQRHHVSTASPETHAIPSALLTVNEGDIIILGVYGNASDWVYGNHNQTYLTVEAYA